MNRSLVIYHQQESAALTERNVKAVDVHSEWGRDLNVVVDSYEPEHVVLHTYHGFENPVNAGIFRDQVNSIKNRVTLGSYAWGFQAYAPEATVSESLALYRSATGHDVPVWFADCEPYHSLGFGDPGPDVDWLLAAGAECQRQGVRKGIYTSPEYAMSRWGDRAYELADWDLWLAHWDWNPELTSIYLPLYGWETIIGKQYGNTPIDQDVFLLSATIPR